MKSRFKLLVRIIALALAIFMIIPAVASCGKKDEAVKSKISNVYKMEYLTLDKKIDNISLLKKIDDKIFAIGSYYDREKGGETKYMSVSMNADGTEQQSAEFAKAAENSNISSFIYDNNNNIWYSSTEYKNDPDTGAQSNIVKLFKSDLSGKVIIEVNFNDMIKDIPEDFYGINQVCCDLNGNLYVVLQKSIYVIDTNGKLIKVLEIEADYVNGISVCGDGSVMIFYYATDLSTTVFRKYDAQTQTLGEETKLPNQVANNSYSIFSGKGHDFYFVSNSGISGYDIATQTVSEVMNYINSDVGDSNINLITMFDDMSMMAVFYDYSGKNEDNSSQIIIMKPVSNEEQVEKYIITLAAPYVDYDVKKAVIGFNRANEEYRIVIKDYSEFNTNEDYTLGATTLNNDIIAGNIPDILQIVNDMPTDSYASKGLFADLNEFFAKDETIKREDYLENIFEAVSTNGKLYTLVPGFYFMTVAAKEATVGDVNGINMDEFNAVIAAHPDALAFNDVTRDMLLNHACTFGINEFIDKDTGICTFESDGFIKILEFAKTLDSKSIYESINWDEIDDDFWTNMENAIRDDRVLFEIESINDFDQYWRIKEGTFGGDVKLVGFPCDSKNGSAITPRFELAMSSKSKLQDGVWEFFKYFLSDEYQEAQYNFPVKLSSLDKMAQKAMTPRTYPDENGKPIEQENTVWYGNESINIGYITKESVDFLVNYIKSLSKVIRYDEKIKKIINEEASVYFSDQKSAEETAKIIQNRVQIYISESR